MAKIGLIPMAARPLHKGHWGLILLAAQECDRVIIFASLSDRGEITGKAMHGVWKDLAEPLLPDNVQVEYGGSPVSKVWGVLGQANEKGSSDTFALYSDPEDIAQNYPSERLEKYAGSLYAKGAIILRAVERSSTTDVSGTQMRKWLAAGDKKRFGANIPPGMDAAEVWRRLKKPKVESLLRRYVKLLLTS